MTKINFKNLNNRKELIDYWSQENILQRKKGYFDYASRRMFDKLLPDIKNKKILDVGCGLGMTMDYFINKNNHIIGIDITPQSIIENNERGLEVLEADARQLPFKNNIFDIVYSLGVIEHFPETELALKEHVRVCKPGGIVVTVIPYLNTPYYLAGILFELLTRNKFSLQITYGKGFRKKDIKQMLQKAGCDNIHISPYYGSAFLRILFNTIYPKLVTAIENSFFSKKFGLVLWSIGYKKTY